MRKLNTEIWQKPRFVLQFIVIVGGVILATNGASTFAAELVRSYNFILRGPEEAAGVIIWSHGKARRSEAKHSQPPRFLDTLNLNGGWDVYRLNRDWNEDKVHQSTEALRDAIKEMQERGYRKIVAAGQSYGAWISVRVAGYANEIHAVIGIAPACCGSWKSNIHGYHKNASFFYPMLSNMNHTRVILAFFRDDDYDPGGRGTESQRILTQRGIPNFVINEPEGFCGHGAGYQWMFARRFGKCIEKFIQPDVELGEFSCPDPRYPPSSC